MSRELRVKINTRINTSINSSICLYSWACPHTYFVPVPWAHTAEQCRDNVSVRACQPSLTLVLFSNKYESKNTPKKLSKSSI